MQQQGTPYGEPWRNPFGGAWANPMLAQGGAQPMPIMPPMAPWGFNPWMAAPAAPAAPAKTDDKKDDDYWKVPEVAGWIVPNSPDALTPWGVNIADGIPVLAAPAQRM